MLKKYAVKKVERNLDELLGSLCLLGGKLVLDVCTKLTNDKYTEQRQWLKDVTALSGLVTVGCVHE